MLGHQGNSLSCPWKEEGALPRQRNREKGVLSRGRSGDSSLSAGLSEASFTLGTETLCSLNVGVGPLWPCDSRESCFIGLILSKARSQRQEPEGSQWKANWDRGLRVTEHPAPWQQRLRWLRTVLSCSPLLGEGTPECQLLGPRVSSGCPFCAVS